MLLVSQVAAVVSEIQGRVCFGILAIAVCEFTNEMGLIPALGPCLSKVHGNGA